MKKVVYCAAGTVASVAIPDSFYAAYAASGRRPPEIEDCRRTLEALTRLPPGERERAGEPELTAACAIWHYCNGEEGDDDIVVIDRTGDGKSTEFAPLSSLKCKAARAGRCHCGELMVRRTH